jgi:outer membrane beta-barrel protein
MTSAAKESNSFVRKGPTIMKRFTLALLFAVVALGGTTSSTTVSAQEILLEGPLAGAPAVRKLVQYREKRFSIGPQVGYTLLNDYMHNFLVGARLEYNFLDWFSAGIVASYAFNVPTKLTEHISQSENLGGTATTPAETGSNWPSYTGASNFEDQVALLKGVYLAQLSLTPFRGKMSMFEKLFVAIDGSIFIGGGIVHYEERVGCNGEKSQTVSGEFEIGCGDFNSFLNDGETSVLAPTRESQIGGAFTWGLNFMAYFNNWFALNLEFRMTPFKWNAGGTDEAGQAASQWDYTNNEGEPESSSSARGSTGSYPDGRISDADKDWNPNMTISLGFIFYLPIDPSIGE